MSNTTSTRARALSHKDYLDTLRLPTLEEAHRISEIQKQHETEIHQKYSTAAEHEAATKIQRIYRGHRSRRELNGLMLTPSTRWSDLIKEWRFRSAIASQYGPESARTDVDGRPRTSAECAKLNWLRAAHVVEHAVDGEALTTRKDDLEEERSREQAESLLLDQRYFLEMVDERHRYGTNLLIYHEYWLRSPTEQNFFYWLDHGDGRQLNLPGCNREKLDKERIRYMSKDERKEYLVRVDDVGKLRWHKNDELITTSAEQFKDSMDGIVPKDDNEAFTFQDEMIARKLSEGRRLVRDMVRTRSGSQRRLSDASNTSISSDPDEYFEPSEADQHLKPNLTAKKLKKKLHVSPATIFNQLLRKSVKPGTWIYVADTVGRLYVGIKATGAFQHASFLSGARISSAGAIGIENGQLTYLSPLSGHYRPTTKSFSVFIKNLKKQGVDLSKMRVSRAFEVLLGMEYYGKTKKEAKRILKHHDEHSAHAESNDPVPVQRRDLSAASTVEQNWDKEHKHRLARLMDDLHVQRRSLDVKNEDR